MFLLPFLQQFLVPGFFSVLFVVASLLPTQQKSQAVHALQNEKQKVASVLATVSPTAVLTPHTSRDIPTKPVQQTATPTSALVSVTPSHIVSLPANTSGIVNANTSISAQGKTITLSMHFPKDGGAISGTISGDCSGSITGTFVSQTSALSGTANATCPVGFFSIPVSITYNGVILSASEAQVHYNVKAMGQTQSGDTTLTLTE